MLKKIVKRFLRQRRERKISEREARRRNLIAQACEHGCVCVVRPLIEKGHMDAAQAKINLCAELIREAREIDRHRHNDRKTEIHVRLRIARDEVHSARKLLIEAARAS